MTPAAALERVRGICLALPRTAEKLSHGMPAFKIEGGRMFAYFWHDHHGDGRTAVIVKTSARDLADAMVAAEPERVFLPPYLGPAGWIGLHLLAPDADWYDVQERIESSWRLVAPRRLLEDARHG